mmetsp:Transcript_8559/g.23819  ORF Transcript_8559/g.23819 Transcript_8559/m.23819 type:complete len:277 (-) Transcript_8559:783-1613(-)
MSEAFCHHVGSFSPNHLLPRHQRMVHQLLFRHGLLLLEQAHQMQASQTWRLAWVQEYIVMKLCFLFQLALTIQRWILGWVSFQTLRRPTPSAKIHRSYHLFGFSELCDHRPCRPLLPPRPLPCNLALRFPSFRPRVLCSQFDQLHSRSLRLRSQYRHARNYPYAAPSCLQRSPQLAHADASQSHWPRTVPLHVLCLRHQCHPKVLRERFHPHARPRHWSYRSRNLADHTSRGVGFPRHFPPRVSPYLVHAHPALRASHLARTSSHPDEVPTSQLQA